MRHCANAAGAAAQVRAPQVKAEEVARVAVKVAAKVAATAGLTVAGVSTPLAAKGPVQAFIGLGANLGDAQTALRDAVQALSQLPGTHLERQSAVYQSAPVDAQGPDYFNAVVQVSTHLEALALLAHLQTIEQQAGRQRPYRNAPRTLDLDLLLYGDQKFDTDTLTVPHPRMPARAFVLLPLHEIAPQQVTAAQLQAVGGQRVVRLPA